MRKHSFIACLAVVGMCASAFAALPPEASKRINKGALADGPRTPAANVQAAGPCGGPCSYFEDFEDAADFTAGTWIGNGLNGAAGGAFETWSATCSSGNGGSNIEGHVETANPFGGSTQHVRISKDPAAATSLFGCMLDARVPSTAVAVGAPVPVSPQTVSYQLAISGPFSANFQIQPQHPSNGMRTATQLMFYYGTIYIIDRVPGSNVFTFAGLWDTSGAYESYGMHIDPCAKFTCNGGGNDGLACNSALDCPDTLDCRGFIEYSNGGGVFYTGQAWAGQNFEQLLFYSDNTGGGNPTGLDIDNVGIERDPNTCPQVCGDGDITGTEECESAGGLDAACPGRCVPAGGSGAQGEPECTCDIGPCAISQDLPNGSMQSFDDHFGWWTFTADAPAYSVESCGTVDYDSALLVFTGTCDNLSYAPGNYYLGPGYSIAYNDDCYDGPAFGKGSDPLGSCWSDDGTGSGYNPPFNSCLCLPTNEGQQYWVFDGRSSFGDETILGLTKRLACGDASAFGACCTPFGDCVDVSTQGDCTALSGSFTASKSCAGVGDQCPPATLGACCDRLSGTCTETSQTACSGNVIYSLGTRCADATCNQATGACCTTTAFDAECVDGQTTDQCNGSDQVWSKDELCANVACTPTPIPTVSEWGLVVMALLLLVGAKVFFGRREALA